MIEVEEHKSKWIITIVLVFICVVLLRTFMIQGFVVRGESMSPTIENGDFVLVNKLAYLWSEPQRGDIVVAWTRDDSKRIVKRVMGLPGEKYAKDDGTINNIDPSEYFLMGDNAEVSAGSNEFDFVDLWDIKGKVIGAIRLNNLKYIDF